MHAFQCFGFLFRGAPIGPDPIAIDRLNFLHILFTFTGVGRALSVSCRHAVSLAVVGATFSPPSKHVTKSLVPKLLGSGTGTYGRSDALGSTRDVRWSKFVGTGKERNAFFPVSFPFLSFPAHFRAYLYCQLQTVVARLILVEFKHFKILQTRKKERYP